MVFITLKETHARISNLPTLCSDGLAPQRSQWLSRMHGQSARHRNKVPTAPEQMVFCAEEHSSRWASLDVQALDEVLYTLTVAATREARVILPNSVKFFQNCNCTGARAQVLTTCQAALGPLAAWWAKVSLPLIGILAQMLEVVKISHIMLFVPTNL